LLLLPSPKASSAPLSPNTPIDPSTLPILKVADFGFARFLTQTDLAETLCGSPLYMAPEILRYQKYDGTADLWSVGAVLYEMVTGRPPFKAQNHLELLKKIETNRDYIKFPGDPQDRSVNSLRSASSSNLNEHQPKQTVSSDLKNLIRGLLVQTPRHRMSFEQLFAHPAVLKDIYSTGSNEPSSGLTHQLKSVSLIHPMTANLRNQLKRSTSLASMQQTNTSPKPTPIVNHNRSRSQIPVSPFRPSSLVEPGHRPRPGNPLQVEPDDEWDTDYVLIEKKAVEVNELADVLGTDASPPIKPNTFPREYLMQKHSQQPSTKDHAQLIKTYLSPRTTPSQPPSYPPPSTKPTPMKEPSSVGWSVGSNTASALARAISSASIKLFGMKNQSPPNSDLHSDSPHPQLDDPSGYSQQYSNDPIGSRQFHPYSSTQFNANQDPTEDSALTHIESIASQAYAVFHFAEEKLQASLPPHSETITYATHASAQEAFLLYMKTLSILYEASNQSKEYWNMLQYNPQKALNPSPRLKNITKWVREKYNQCLERAEIARTRMATNAPSSVISVDLLIFNKALEICRSASVDELVGENHHQCEKVQRYAIWLLHAMQQRAPEDAPIHEEDLAQIKYFIEVMNKRLVALRKSLDTTLDLSHSSGLFPQ
jgi:serine/threonine-protein kinase ULK/ATG1